MRLTIDTNAYSNLNRGDQQVFALLASAHKIYLSVIVIGELVSGFEGGNRKELNKQILLRFTQRPTVEILELNKEVSFLYGQLAGSLKSSGRQIPTNDMWIAAQAIETGSAVVTYDRHFERIPGLKLILLN